MSKSSAARTDSSLDPSVEDMLAAQLSLSSVTVQGAKRTSRALLDRITKPVLSTGGTFSSVVDDVSRAVDLLRSTQCFRGVDAYLDTSSTDAGAVAVFTLSEKSLYQLHTGTTIDASPGSPNDPSVEASFLWRNVSGHADSLKAAVSWMGGAAGETFAARPTSRTNIDYRRPFALGLHTGVFAGLSSAVHNHENRSSHSLSSRSATLGVDHPAGRLSVVTDWRHMLHVDDKASPLIRSDAGHSWKTSLRHVLHLDGRDSPRIPTAGSSITLSTETTLPLGDVRLSKAELIAQRHTSLGSSGVAVSLVGRAGALWAPSRANVIDRFFLGGANSLRGFEVRGVGPRDADDAVGGDVYYAGCAMASIPLPPTSVLSQLFNARLHIFATAGDLMDGARAGELARSVKNIAVPQANATVGSTDAQPTSGKIMDRVRGTGNEFWKSMRVAVGLGMALDTAVGRVELNFSRVLRSAKQDLGVTGFQFGISEEFA